VLKFQKAPYFNRKLKKDSYFNTGHP